MADVDDALEAGVGALQALEVDPAELVEGS